MNDHELQQLIDAYLDDDLTAQQILRLEELLQQPAAMAKFVEQTHLHRQLQDAWLAQREQATGTSEWEDESEAKLPLASPRRNVRKAARGAKDFFTRPTPTSFAVAAITLGLLVAVMAFTVPPFYRQLIKSNSSPAVPTFVAELTQSHQAQWAPGQIGVHRGAHLSAGHRLQLNKGLAEIKFRSGARLVLEGPVEIEIETAKSVGLQNGKLRASVPPAAVGFRIVTPSSVITDLGTEFGVQVDGEEEIAVHVFVGKVAIAFNSNAMKGSQTELLTAGEAIALRPNLPEVLRLAANEAGFRRSLPVTTALPLKNPSFEEDGRDLNQGTPPSGWLIQSRNPRAAGCEDHVTNGNFTSGLNGRFVGYLNTDAEDLERALIQNTDHAVAAGATYRMRVSIGRRNDADEAPRFWPVTFWGIGLFDASTGEVLAQKTGQLSQCGILIPQTLEWQAAPQDVGRKLQVRLFFPSKVEGAGQVNFDNVVLYQTTSEEVSASAAKKSAD